MSDLPPTAQVAPTQKRSYIAGGCTSIDSPARKREGESRSPPSLLRRYFLSRLAFLLLAGRAGLAWLASAEAIRRVRRCRFRDGVALADSVSAMSFALIVAAVCWQDGWYT